MGALLEMIGEVSPPLAPKLLHKLLNAMEYLPKQAKLKQMELLKTWAPKIEKVLLPILNTSDEDVQLATVEVLKKVIPNLKNALPSDTNFAWSFIHSNLDMKTRAPLLFELLKLVQLFPLERLNEELRENLLSILTKLTFHPEHTVRGMVYELIGSSAEFWRASSLFNAALGILFLSLGDQNVDCARKVIDIIIQWLQQSPFKNVLVTLGLLRDTLGGPVRVTLRAFDDLANFIAKERVDFAELIDAITQESSVDEYWMFFLDDAPENQLVRPDDYNYNRNFIHAPFWISILLSKLNVNPPPLTIGETTRRDQMPTSPANKRRYICGFMLCLLPTCGMPDPLLRRSALDILSFIVRLKLPGISPAILLQFLDMTLDIAFNSPTSIIKMGALNLLESFILVFPGGISSKLPDVRDVLRALIIDKEADVSTADPLISSLSDIEKKRVISLSIQGLGAIASQNSAYSIIQELLKYLSSPESVFRHAAFTAILSQMHQLDNIENSTIMWLLLPLYGDVYKPIRLAFSRFMRKIPSPLESYFKAVPPHPDDSYILSATTWEEILLDGAMIIANSKNLAEIIYDLDHLTTYSHSDQLPVEDSNFNLPTISEKLLSRLKFLAKTLTGVVPTISINQVIYHIQSLQRYKPNEGNSLLVLSEFCCYHENTLNEIVDVLTANLNYDLTPENSMRIEASILGLKNISEYAPTAFKQILYKVTAPAGANEGEILALLYRIESIRDLGANKTPEIIRKYLPLISSQRYSLRKRILAFKLAVELSLIAGPDEVAKVLDTIQPLLDSLENEEDRRQVYGSLAKVLSSAGTKHPLFRILLGNCKKDIKSKFLRNRLKSLDVFRIFMKTMAPEDCMWFCFLYLADSNQEVRRRAKELIVTEGLIDYALNGLRVAIIHTNSRRANIVETCKLPSIQKLGVTVNTNATEDVEVSIPDPFNYLYYTSDRRRKFTTRYGLSEHYFAKANQPVAQSILAAIRAKYSYFVDPPPEVVEKYQWVLNYDTTTILHECFKHYPQIAKDLIESHIDQIESAVNALAEPDEDYEDHGDIENEIHTFDLLSNLLFAYDGISEHSVTYLARIRGLVLTCNEKAEIIRESLYVDLENSFYFFNEYVDVPIVSEEQYLAIEAFKASSQEATLEAVKSGKTDKLSGLDAKKTELNDIVDSKSEQLRKLTILALHGTSGYGLYFALSNGKSLEIGGTCTDTQLNESVAFLSSMLDNEHRGIRIAAVEAVTTITRLQLESLVKANFVAKIQEIISGFLGRLKADMINLIAQLGIFVKERSLRHDIVKTIMQFWRDPDSEVRVISIKMIQLLAESGVQEVTENFHLRDGNANALPSIMRELVSLMANTEYIEKDQLQNLLAWNFSSKKVET
ncbi:hypothetical protein HDU76_002509 [Blyttiomyces sp. JEL0837]|nr:hypothetical protein HDU76_002509 [Blyttiomyces sp. JEL0837]